MCFSLLTTPAFAVVPTVTAEPTATPTATAEPTVTAEPTATPIATAEPTATVVPTATSMPAVTVEPTATVVPTATVEPTATPTVSATPVPTMEIGKLSLSPEQKALQITGGVEGEDYTYDAGTLTFIKSGSYTISMAPGVTTTTDHIASAAAVELTLTLNGVVIDVSESANTSAIDFNSAGACTLVLAAGSVNNLKAGQNHPGIYVPQGNKITITGTGSLTATGGQYWPGIGRNGNGNIEIQSGTINSFGSDCGAGIGGSYGFDGGAVLITGGQITATGGYGSAGIGGGYIAREGNITITGGTVKAVGGYHASGIGAGRDAAYGTSGALVFAGGSIELQGGTSKVPVNAAAQPVYLTTITLPHSEAGTAVTELQTSLGDGAYPITDVKLNSAGKLLLYLPSGTQTTKIVTTQYTYEGTATTGDTATTAYLVLPDFVITGGAQGVDYTYEKGQLVILKGGSYTVAMAPFAVGQASMGTIQVANGVTAQLTLDGVWIDVSKAPGQTALNLTGANVTLNLENDVKLFSGAACAGILAPAGSTLQIVAGPGATLQVSGGSDGAGIGGGNTQAAGDITIENGQITAKGGSSAAGIGGGAGGAGGNIALHGGTITAFGGGQDLGAGAGGDNGILTITGGAIRTSSGALAVQPTNGVVPVYRTELLLAHLTGQNKVQALTLSSGSYGTSDLYASGEQLYLYLPAGVTVTEAAVDANVYTGAVTTKADGSAWGYLCYLKEFTVSGGVNGTDYSYPGNQLTFEKSGAYTLSMTPGVSTAYLDEIKIASGAVVHLTVDSLRVDGQKNMQSPISVAPGATLYLTITGANQFTGGPGAAGIHVPPGAALVLGGSGRLSFSNEIMHVEQNALQGAGIGGNAGESCGTITVNGAELSSYNSYAACIGGGSSASGGKVIINGGKLNFRTEQGAAIGGGEQGDGGDITVTGGQITAEAYTQGAVLGGGSGGAGGQVFISGGTLSLTNYGDGAGIGGGKSGNGGTVCITGGNVNVNNYGVGEAIGKGTFGLQSGSLKNADGADVFLTTLDLGLVPQAISEHDLIFGGVAAAYGTKGLTTIDDQIYCYLPQGQATAAYRNSYYTATVNTVHANQFVLDSATTVYTAQFTLQKLSFKRTSGILYSGNTFVGTLLAEEGYLPPSTITVNMGATVLQRGIDYTYNATTGVLTVPNVTDNLTIQAQGILKTYKIALAPAKLDFGSFSAGYTASPAPQTVTVTNNGTGTVRLVLPQSTAFTIGNFSVTQLAGGQSATFTVQPKAGLAAGEYRQQLTVTTQEGVKADFETAFTVTPAVGTTVTVATPVATPTPARTPAPARAVATPTPLPTATPAPLQSPTPQPEAEQLTLTDTDTGITVSGNMQNDAKLLVRQLDLGQSEAEQQLASKIKEDAKFFLFGKEISIQGEYTGPLVLTVPVDQQYEGKTVTVLHAAKQGLETLTAVVQGGAVQITVNSLSPFGFFILGQQVSHFSVWAAVGIVVIVLAGAAAFVYRRKHGADK
ncbi:MAG: fibronectin-binding autotransporter adhesin [Clostridiales bacterium]|nr:fibronectin-binding autotransporter adhesin [Clostridiales bacterium]